MNREEQMRLIFDRYVELCHAMIAFTQDGERVKVEWTGAISGASALVRAFYQDIFGVEIPPEEVHEERR